MPRLINAVPRYRKHRATGQAVVTINGRDNYLGPHGTKASRPEYDRLITEWLSSGRSVSFGSNPSAITVVEVIADYVGFAKAYYGDHSRSELAHMIRVARPLKDLYGRTPAEEFGPLQLKAIRQRFIDEGCSRTFANACVRRVIRIFRWAAAEGRISPSVPNSLAMVPGLRRGKTDARETEPILPVDDATVDATLPHMPAVVADMVRLQRLTGMRPAELCILRPCDLDRIGDVWTYVPSRHKTEHHGRERTIFLGPKGQAILLRYLARDAETYCFRPCDSEAKRRAEQHDARKTPLSCGNRLGTNRKRKPKRSAGECYTTASYRRAIHRACDKAFPHPNLADVRAADLTDDQRAELTKWQSDHRWSPNRLRHTAATEIRREFGLEAAQVILGHSQANVTQMYAERDLAKGVEVARRIG